MAFFGDFSFDSAPKNSPDVISLFNAASRNQLEKLNQIVERNPSVNVSEDVNGFNCLLIASKKGHLEIVKRIHELFPDIIHSRTSDNERTCLMLAAFEGHDSTVEFLAEYEVHHYHHSMRFQLQSIPHICHILYSSTQFYHHIILSIDKFL